MRVTQAAAESTTSFQFPPSYLIDLAHEARAADLADESAASSAAAACAMRANPRRDRSAIPCRSCSPSEQLSTQLEIAGRHAADAAVEPALAEPRLALRAQVGEAPVLVENADEPGQRAQRLGVISR
jgi:hypothetical protein